MGSLEITKYDDSIHVLRLPTVNSKRVIQNSGIILSFRKVVKTCTEHIQNTLHISRFKTNRDKPKLVQKRISISDFTQPHSRQRRKARPQVRLEIAGCYDKLQSVVLVFRSHTWLGYVQFFDSANRKRN